ncbi:rho GTPase-activating protein 29-like isoform X3 [Scleropages formosus]|uniref:rho GTPase-activating protein 29-like isoform X3 n=1 Tax=Scleropages formosus TaxID=113540 RepID=UPI000878F09D|nr:rho GTPase-activating protein 29-like isoform X3 [Scleropages formosus]
MWQQSDSGGNKCSVGVAHPPSSHRFPPQADHLRSGQGGMEAPGADPDYIMQLVSDVRRFADVLLHLKEAFQCKENQESLECMVRERLAELLRVLKAVIGKYQSLNSVDILSAAGTVIAKVKALNFSNVNEENRRHIFGEIHTSIDTLAFTFGNVVSDFLMGDVDSGSVLGSPHSRRSQSFENVSVDFRGSVLEKDDPPGPLCTEELDLALLNQHSGVESALLYAKAWSKYAKDLLAWVDKRLGQDIECAKSLAKMAESARSLANQQEFMPFRDIYVSAFKNDMEYSQLLLQTASALQTNKFVQPLLARKNELDRLRKDIKEQWQKEQKKMQEADIALRKAKAVQAQRKEEYEKARCSASRMEEEAPPPGAKQLEKRRRLEEEALQRAEEANDQYKACVADIGLKKVDMATAKSHILTRVRELVFQCDLTLKAVTVNWFQMQQVQASSVPLNLQTLCESAKLYEPGRCYSEFVRSLPKDRIPLESFSLGAQGPQNTGGPLTKQSTSSTHSSHGNLSQMSVTSSDLHSTEEVESPAPTRTGQVQEFPSDSSTDVRAVKPERARRVWSSGSQGGGMCSDSESVGGSSESRSMDSPTASPGDFKRRLPRTPSTGTMSSADDLDEREPPSPSDNGLGVMVTETASSPGPFRNTQMSKAAQTHKLRKLRAPSKCRECDSLVMFHGAECEECSLACHKKCLETLAIQCGHKKLLGRLHLFGVDFSQAAKSNPDGIPFIIKKCTSEIESRALNLKGIYRVNGAKSRVEKLCQAFENGKDLVELSDFYPHDISNVLKLYLRQLPEPLILFRYYNDFIGLAKESQSIIMDEVDAARARSTTNPAQPSVELNRVLFKIRDLLRQLPPAHYRTLQFLIGHLHRVTEKADENKMTASNLGIIFGPTLIKPRQIDAEVSLSSLVDYPYQALIVELLIRHYNKVFDMPPNPVTAGGSLLPPKGVEARLSAEEKEARLSRNCKSLVDVKEQNSKVYKRHSSIIPTSHLVDDVKETKSRPGGSELAPEKLNGEVASSGVPEVHRSTLVLERPNVSTARVLLRPARARLVSRPVSMPVERLLGPAQVLEKNTRNSSTHERNHAIQEGVEPETSGLRVSTYYRSPYIDTQTLRRTWDKQYKHYDITPRTAMIMANIPSDSSGSVGTTVSSSSDPPAIPYIPARTLRRENNIGETTLVAGALKPARTLRPPPGTFYKPPSSHKAKPQKESEVQLSATPISSASAEALPGPRNLVDEPMEAEATVSPSRSQPQSPSSGPEDFGPSEARPVYQRLRTRKMQEFEHREAHFV